MSIVLSETEFISENMYFLDINLIKLYFEFLYYLIQYIPYIIAFFMIYIYLEDVSLSNEEMVNALFPIIQRIDNNIFQERQTFYELFIQHYGANKELVSNLENKFMSFDNFMKEFEIKQKQQENNKNEKQKEIDSLVEKIKQHFEWFLSINTWRIKCPVQGYREMELTDEKNGITKLYKIKQLFGHGLSYLYTFTLFQSTEDIMNKYFEMQKYKNIITYDLNETILNKNELKKHFMSCYTSEPDRIGPYYNYARLMYCLNTPDKNKSTTTEINATTHKIYNDFLLSIKDLNETDEEFEIRFLREIYKTLKNIYSNYKLYIYACEYEDKCKSIVQSNIPSF